MTDSRTGSSQLAPGWCIHGVAYGPGWYCVECAPPTTFRTIEVPVFTREDIDRIIRLLTSIEYHVRTRK